VLLQVTVSAEGRTVEARVVRGGPFGLNEAAMNAVHDRKFKPATREGKPATGMVMIEATFRLNLRSEVFRIVGWGIACVWERTLLSALFQFG